MIAMEIGSNISTFFYLWGVHLIINAVGLVQVKSETARVGNDQILENFKEGVILVESSENQNEVLFAN